jgi:hypothetical protein
MFPSKLFYVYELLTRILDHLLAAVCMKVMYRTSNPPFSVAYLGSGVRDSFFPDHGSRIPILNFL